MSEDIANDEKIVAELLEERGKYEDKLKSQEEKMGELQNTLRDLEQKAKMDDISDSTKEKVEEVISQVKDRIGEFEPRIEDLRGKIKKIDETLAPDPEEKPEVERNGEITGREKKILELRERISQKETERSALEAQKAAAENSEFIYSIDAQIQLVEQQKERLGQTARQIDEKIGDSGINEATRERLEEMKDEVCDKIDELDDKIDELRDKKEEYTDQINDKIDELNDEIAELGDEIAEIEEEIEQANSTVDENVINEVKKSTGFDDLGSFINRITETVSNALANIKIPEINIPPIPEIKIPNFDAKIEVGENGGEITFDDIVGIAPFAKKETLDKLVDKLTASKADFGAIVKLAPFLRKDTLDKLVDRLDEEIEFDKIKALAPFLGKDALMRCVRKGGKIDMKRVKSLAPFLGSDYIDEIISTML